MAVATASWFPQNRKESTCCNSAFCGWGNEPVARGDALSAASASRQNTVAFLLLLEEPDADKTSHSNNVVVPGRLPVSGEGCTPDGKLNARVIDRQLQPYRARRAAFRYTTTMRAALPVSEFRTDLSLPNPPRWKRYKSVLESVSALMPCSRQCPSSCLSFHHLYRYILKVSYNLSDIFMLDEQLITVGELLDRLKAPPARH